MPDSSESMQGMSDCRLAKLANKPDLWGNKPETWGCTPVMWGCKQDLSASTPVTLGCKLGKLANRRDLWDCKQVRLANTAGRRDCTPDLTHCNYRWLERRRERTHPTPSD